MEKKNEDLYFLKESFLQLQFQKKEYWKYSQLSNMINIRHLSEDNTIVLQ